MGVCPPVPPSVRVTRPGHPLHGLELVVWGRLRRRGRLELLLVLPDGSKKQIPASWTDLGGVSGAGLAEAVEAAGVVAPADELLRVREVVSELLARVGGEQEQAARQSPGKEDNRAARTAQSAAGTGSGATIPSGRPAARAARAGSGADARPAHCSGGADGASAGAPRRRDR